jgi:heme exporter protein D
MDFGLDLAPALGPHAGFIIGAYLVAAAVVAALVIWVMADHAAQRRALAELESRGITRRSAQSRPAQIKEPA